MINNLIHRGNFYADMRSLEKMSLEQSRSSVSDSHPGETDSGNGSYAAPLDTVEISGNSEIQVAPLMSFVDPAPHRAALDGLMNHYKSDPDPRVNEDVGLRSRSGRFLATAIQDGSYFVMEEGGATTTSGSKGAAQASISGQLGVRYVYNPKDKTWTAYEVSSEEGAGGAGASVPFPFSQCRYESAGAVKDPKTPGYSVGFGMPFLTYTDSTSFTGGGQISTRTYSPPGIGITLNVSRQTKARQISKPCKSLEEAKAQARKNDPRLFAFLDQLKGNKK